MIGGWLFRNWMTKLSTLFLIGGMGHMATSQNVQTNFRCSLFHPVAVSAPCMVGVFVEDSMGMQKTLNLYDQNMELFSEQGKNPRYTFSKLISEPIRKLSKGDYNYTALSQKRFVEVDSEIPTDVIITYPLVSMQRYPDVIGFIAFGATNAELSNLKLLRQIPKVNVLAGTVLESMAYYQYDVSCATKALGVGECHGDPKKDTLELLYFRILHKRGIAEWVIIALATWLGLIGLEHVLRMPGVRHALRFVASLKGGRFEIAVTKLLDNTSKRRRLSDIAADIKDIKKEVQDGTDIKSDGK